MPVWGKTHRAGSADRTLDKTQIEENWNWRYVHRRAANTTGLNKRNVQEEAPKYEHFTQILLCPRVGDRACTQILLCLRVGIRACTGHIYIRPPSASFSKH